MGVKKKNLYSCFHTNNNIDQFMYLCKDGIVTTNEKLISTEHNEQ